MIVHVETARTSHAWQHTVAQEIIAGMSQAATSGELIFGELVERSIDDLERSVTAGGYTLPDRDTIVAMVREAFIKGGVVTEKVNSDNDVQALLDENAGVALAHPTTCSSAGRSWTAVSPCPTCWASSMAALPRKCSRTRCSNTRGCMATGLRKTWP